MEANHIHNLPGLLRSYKPVLLRYYLEVERPSYLHQLSKLNIRYAPDYRAQWKRLEKYL